MRAVLFWIPGPWSGRLAIVPRPRGGDWLEDEVRAWQSAGIETVISALTREEAEELDIAREAELCQAIGIEYIAFPMPDRGIPSSVRAVVEMLRPLERRLNADRTIAIHCRQGVGRSALLAACLLTLGGMGPDEAWERIKVARGCGVPDTAEQRQWVAKFAKDMLVTAVQP